MSTITATRYLQEQRKADHHSLTAKPTVELSPTARAILREGEKRLRYTAGHILWSSALEGHKDQSCAYPSEGASKQHTFTGKVSVDRATVWNGTPSILDGRQYRLPKNHPAIPYKHYITATGFCGGTVVMWVREPTPRGHRTTAFVFEGSLPEPMVIKGDPYGRAI